MRIVVNGQELHVPPAPGGLLVSVHIDPEDEYFGPITMDLFGGVLTFKGNDRQDHAMLVRGNGDARIEFWPSPIPRGGQTIASDWRDTITENTAVEQRPTDVAAPVEVKLPRGGMF